MTLAALNAPQWRRALPTAPLIAAVVATVAIWIAHPALGDLQAAIAREHAAESGVGLGYWFSWYGGLAPGSYSLIVPTLSSWFGSLTQLCVSTILIAAAAYPLSRGGTHPTLLSWTVAIAAVLNLMSGRVTFAVGALIAIVGLLALQRGMTGTALVLVAVSGLASPLAPAFVGLVTVPFAVGHSPRARVAWQVLIGAALGVLVPFVLFGAPGAQGFPATTLFWVILIGVCAAFVLTDSPVRWIMPLALASALVIFAIPNGVGSNLSRFFCLVVPALCFQYSRRSWKVIVIALIPAIVYAAFVAIADQVAVANADGSDEAYQPLRAELLAKPDLMNNRVELVDAGTHAGSHALGDRVQLARGWENQSDNEYNDIFYTKDALTADSYRNWLADNAVAYVAVATEPLRQNKAEAALAKSDLPYLSEVWHNDDWVLYRVADPKPIVPAPLKLLQTSPKQVTMYVPDTATHLLKYRWGRYLVARSSTDNSVAACITKTPDGWITLRALMPGNYTLSGQVTLPGVLSEQPAGCTK